MAQREPPNMMMSFLDLLLSALGGVALLMMLFAAIQTQNAQAARRLTSQIVSVELLASASSPLDRLVLGEEIGLLVSTEEGFRSVQPETAATPPSKLIVRWEDPRRRRYRFVVQSDPDVVPMLTLWLRQHHAERVDPFLAALREGVSLQVGWTGMDGEPRRVELHAAGGYLARVEMAR